jgi:molybdopterin molybdotransferase
MVKTRWGYMELLKVMSVNEVKNLISEKVTFKLAFEKVSILNCVGRVCSQNVKAACCIPEFRRSTVDGYAVNSRDVFGASESMPAMMDLKGEVLMGKTPNGEIYFSGECFYVPTGGMLPQGADSVVMIEYTEKLDESTILINSSVAPGDNVIQIGEDINDNDIVIREGQKLRPYEVGVLASLGIKEIMVYKRPKVAIISTGDEIVPCDSEPALGEVRDINTYLLFSALQLDGCEPISYGIVRDDFELLKNTMDRALPECDIVLISGGSSVGKKDQSLKVISAYNNGGVLVHGIAVKPGKPTIVGMVGDKIVFGLPGHPLAASVIYKILVKDYINKLMKHNEVSYGITAEMSMNYHKAKGREEYLPVMLQLVEGQVVARPVFGKSGLITTFSRAFGYVKIEKNIEGLVEGQMVEVFEL